MLRRVVVSSPEGHHISHALRCIQARVVPEHDAPTFHTYEPTDRQPEDGEKREPTRKSAAANRLYGTGRTASRTSERVRARLAIFTDTWLIPMPGSVRQVKTPKPPGFCFPPGATSPHCTPPNGSLLAMKLLCRATQVGCESSAGVGPNTRNGTHELTKSLVLFRYLWNWQSVPSV